jgi:hypothetical protein
VSGIDERTSRTVVVAWALGGTSPVVPCGWHQIGSRPDPFLMPAEEPGFASSDITP